jgi:hypothetical protein
MAETVPDWQRQSLGQGGAARCVTVPTDRMVVRPTVGEGWRLPKVKKKMAVSLLSPNISLSRDLDLERP